MCEGPKSTGCGKGVDLEFAFAFQSTISASCPSRFSGVNRHWTAYGECCQCHRRAADSSCSVGPERWRHANIGDHEASLAPKPSLRDVEAIATLYAQGVKVLGRAKATGRDPDTILRELRPSATKGACAAGYWLTAA